MSQDTEPGGVVNDGNSVLRDEVRAMRDRTALAGSVYAALKRSQQLKSHRVIDYRCPQRCLLLDVLNLPQGALFHQTGYKLPPAVNDATSSASGRAKNTRDGKNHWEARTYFAEDCVNVSLDCAHVHQVVIDKTQVQADIDTGRVEMIVGADGDRRPR